MNSIECLIPYFPQIRELIDRSHVVLPKECNVKLYHHAGVENFSSVGAVFIDVIQSDYCKFVVVMMKGQAYPQHFHRIKDESYFVLDGELRVAIEDTSFLLTKGDITSVHRRFTHSFSTDTGCVFEEVSTAYLNNDSVYEDPQIKNMQREKKVTVVPLSFLLGGV